MRILLILLAATSIAFAGDRPKRIDQIEAKFHIKYTSTFTGNDETWWLFMGLSHSITLNTDRMLPISVLKNATDKEVKTAIASAEGVGEFYDIQLKDYFSKHPEQKQDMKAPQWYF